MSSATRTSAVLLVAAACLVVGSTSGAVAGSMITGAKIKNGTVASIDLKNNSVASVDLKDGTVASVDVKDGSLRLGDLTPAAVDSLSGASAHGYVAANGTLLRASAGVSVTTGPTGVYCISAPGVSPDTSVLVANADFQNDSTNIVTGDQSFAVARLGSLCPAGQFTVTTLQRTQSSGVLSLSNQPFMFVIG